MDQGAKEMGNWDRRWNKWHISMVFTRSVFRAKTFHYMRNSVLTRLHVHIWSSSEEFFEKKVNGAQEKEIKRVDD
jgi:hypothetical protein